MNLVYLDTETTGLDPNKHEVWEIAYAADDGPIERSFVRHSLKAATPKALEIGRYTERFIVSESLRSGPFEADLREELDGATLVGANPAFDAAFLRARWGETPWKYRLLDIEAYAMGALGYSEPKGLAAIADDLVALGHTIPLPDHTAAGDVECVRAAHLALRSIYKEKQ